MIINTDKAYLNDIRVTNISKNFTHKLGAKTSWHRYGTKLRHCHRMYCDDRDCVFLPAIISTENTRPIFANFCACYLRPWLGPPLAA